MSEASIPVNLRNPGQVFASLGFLEVADVVLGEAKGGFDWSNRTEVRFCLKAAGAMNPFAAVLEFLADADVRCYAPQDYRNRSKDDEEAGEATIDRSDTFPAAEGDRMALPVRLIRGNQLVRVGHWADETRPSSFKLYAGNRSGFSITTDMLHGKRQKPTTKGVRSLWCEERERLLTRPFDVVTAMGGSFNLDPRGGWTALGAGYSPNEHSDHAVMASPVVEILAACGLEHARPLEVTDRMRYGVWPPFAPAALARTALGGADPALGIRTFTFVLSGKYNKVVSFSREETSHDDNGDSRR